MKKEKLLKNIFIIIVCFTIINLVLKIKDIKQRIPYWNSKDINSDFLSYFRHEYARMGWINLEKPDYDYTHDVSFFWFRFLLMPTQLDNRSIQDKIIIKYKTLLM